jgi:chromosome segregation protein
MAPVGTLADFLEVSGAHEGVVDEFLREELNYVVVESWVAAEEGVKLLKSGVDGRATFLIHPRSRARFLRRATTPISGPGLTPLKDSIRVLNGFGRSLESILPKLGTATWLRTPDEAQRLAAQYPHAYFLTPEGECFHNATVTGGKPASEGPLALKRELREAEGRLANWKRAWRRRRRKPRR